jgi:hypothetical protein
MRLLYSLPVIAALTLTPSLASAQAAALAPSQATTAAPALYAEAESPATYSSSADNSLSASTLPASHALAGAAAAAAAPAPASGSTKPFSSLGVGVKIGIGGIGFDAATPIFPGRLNVRGGAGFFSFNANETVNNQAVNANLKLNNAEVMADYFPFKGSFRLSAGLNVYNNTGVTGSTTIAGGGTIKIGNTTYTSDPATGEQITPNVSAKFGGNAVPRFTLGWGNLAKRTGHWSFDTEFGIEIDGTPTVGWTYGGQGCTGSNSGGSGFRPGVASTACYMGSAWGPVGTTDISAQNASLQSDFNSFKVFPIFSIGIGYKIGH